MRASTSARNRRESQSANSGLTVCQKRLLWSSRFLKFSVAWGWLERSNDPALGLPVGWQRIDTEPFCGEARGLIALDDLLHNFGSKEGQIDNLHDPALGQVFGFGDLFERLTAFDRIILLMHLGDAADQGGVNRLRRLGTDYEFRFHATLSELERHFDCSHIRV